MSRFTDLALMRLAFLCITAGCQVASSNVQTDSPGMDNDTAVSNALPGMEIDHHPPTTVSCREAKRASKKNPAASNLVDEHFSCTFRDTMDTTSVHDNAGADFEEAGVEYVSSKGDDANSGLSWTKAKHTVYGAMIALPDGSAGPPARAGHGTIYIADGSQANPIANAGIWIMGTGDPRYGKLPAGWVRYGGPVKFVGQGCSDTASNNAFGGQCYVVAGGNQDFVHPAVWISGLGGSLSFSGLLFKYPNKGFMIGIDSSGNRNPGANVAGIHIDNVGVNLNNVAGAGPGIDIGGGSFNIWISHYSGGGSYANEALIAEAGLFRDNGIVTITTAKTHTLFSGMNCGIVGASDPSFNSSFRNVFVVDKTTIKVKQAGPNAKSGGGIFMCDQIEGVLVDPGGSLIYVRDSVMAGTRVWPGTAGNVYVSGTYSEGDYTHCVPPLLWLGNTGTSAQTYVELSGGQVADQCRLANDAPIPTAKNDCLCTSNNFVLISSGGVPAYTEGPMTTIGVNTDPFTYLPLRWGQRGIQGGHLYGQIDVARRSPQSVRFPNYAPSNPNAWVVSNRTNLTTGVVDRDGGNYAARAVSNDNEYVNFLNSTSIGPPSSVGDIYICGVWVRSTATFTPYLGAGYRGSPTNPMSCGLTPWSGTLAYNASQGASVAGDNEWEWVWSVQKIASQTSPGNSFTFGVNVGPGKGLELYSPIALHIAADAISDNEAFNLAQELRAYNDACVPGQSCDSFGSFERGGYSSTVYDNFNRADAGIGENWKMLEGGFDISANQIRGTEKANAALWSAEPLGGPQYAQATISALSGIDLAGVIVAASDSGGVSYVGCAESNAQLQMFYRQNGGGAFLVGSPVIGSIGDVIRLEGKDDVYTCYRNGSSVLRYGPRAQLPTSGSPGIYLQRSDAALDNWSGGAMRSKDQVDVESDIIQPKHFMKAITVGPSNPVPGALEVGVYTPRISSGSYVTKTICNSKTSPAECGSSAAGSVAVPVGSRTLRVNTTAVTADSQILIIEDRSLGIRLGIACESAASREPLSITDRVAGEGFTFAAAVPITNPRCVSFQILN